MISSKVIDKVIIIEFQQMKFLEVEFINVVSEMYPKGYINLTASE